MNAVVDAPARGYCATLCHVASLLVGGLTGALLVEARSRGGAGKQALAMHFDGRRIPALERLPMAALSLLEDPGGWELRLAPGLRALDGRGEPFATHVLFASWALPIEHGAPDGTVFRYYVSDDQVQRVAAALEGFPLPASLLVDAGSEVTALWALDVPIHDLAQLRAIQRALAVALGADVDERPQPNGRPTVSADDPGAFIPWGGTARNMGSAAIAPTIAWPLVESRRVYALTDLERAIAANSVATPRKKGARQ